MAKQNNEFTERTQSKFRVSILNENTLNEVWHTRLSRFGIIAYISLLLIVSFALLALLIWLTPLKNYLPGYDANIRQELYSQVELVDSLSTELSIQREYLSMIHDVLTGDIESDSVAPLDSVAVHQRVLLLEQRSAVTDAFVAQYEEKERESLLIFDAHNNAPSITFFRPTNGVIELNTDNKVSIRTPKSANVTATLSGTVVFCERSANHTWVMTLQHDNDYMSIYHGIAQPLKKVGDRVRQAETIGLMGNDEVLVFSIWQHGTPINPEEAIVW